jgi:hypothetical protein
MATGADRSWGYNRLALSATVPQGAAAPLDAAAPYALIGLAEPPGRTDPAEAGEAHLAGTRGCALELCSTAWVRERQTPRVNGCRATLPGTETSQAVVEERPSGDGMSPLSQRL